jgi:LacI family transcriptional regulator
VLEYAEKINYRPNPVALSLKGRRNCSIGVIVSEIANNFFSQAINGIESIAYNRGYHIIISQSHESYEREVVNVQHLASRSVDGLLVSLSSETKDLAYLINMHEKGMPIVFFDRISDEINTYKVIADNAKASYDATMHLIKKGYKKIGHITNTVNLSITKERLNGYKKALEENGLPFNEKYVQYCNHGGMVTEEIEMALKSMMAQKPKPDAVVTASDRITTCLLSAAQKLKLKIPENIGVVGFTNTNIPELFNPPITTIRQPAFEMGQVATELLIKIIESKRPITEFETKVLDTELTVRESA